MAVPSACAHDTDNFMARRAAFLCSLHGAQRFSFLGVWRGGCFEPGRDEPPSKARDSVCLGIHCLLHAGRPGRSGHSRHRRVRAPARRSFFARFWLAVAVVEAAIMAAAWVATTTSSPPSFEPTHRGENGDDGVRTPATTTTTTTTTKRKRRRRQGSRRR